MLTVFVIARGDAIALADTLAALVPAAVDGLVRRVVVITAPGPSEDVAALIEASGAVHLVAPDNPLALWGAPRPDRAQDWSLFLLAGMRPLNDWAEMIARHISRANAGAACFELAAGWRARVRESARRLLGRTDPASGLLTRGGTESGRLTRLPARLEDRRARS